MERQIELKRSKGTETVVGNGQLIPVVQNGKKKMLPKSKVEKLLKTKPKVKFNSTEIGVDVEIVDKEIPTPKEKSKKQVSVDQFTKALDDLKLDITTDKQGYVTYKQDKRNLCYCKDTNFGFSIYHRDDSAKSGWKSRRVISKKEFEAEVETIERMVEHYKKYEGALVPYYLCPECEYKTTSKSEMITHLEEH